jgi:two-component system, chemotaxis family, protein-glutamate methylesterase/glutaminase
MVAPERTTERALRVLVADGPSPERRTLCAGLANVAGVILTATVSTTELARRKVTAGEVDVLLIDPTLDDGAGFALVRDVSRGFPEVGCFFLSDRSGRGTAATDTILAGALGVIARPASTLSPEQARDAIRPGLAPVLGSAVVPVAVPFVDARPTPPRLVLAMPCPARRELIAIGVSTGGPPAVTLVLRALPRDLKTPIVIVQHMGADHLPHFVSLLASQCERNVVLAKSGAKLERSTVYVAPGGTHLILDRRPAGFFLALTDAPPEHSCRPAVDPFFRSVATACGASALGVVMTGMGSDGALGAKAMRDAGAPVIVQDEATSVVWGMPGATVALGAANVVVPLELIAREIMSWTAE